MADKACCSDLETQKLSAVNMSLLFVCAADWQYLCKWSRRGQGAGLGTAELVTWSRSSFHPCGLVWTSSSQSAGVSPQEGLWALWTWPPSFGGESECSCEDTSCAVPVLHRTQELFSGCCIHPYNSAYRDNSEAEAYSYSTYLYSTAKSATHSGVLGQQQETELAPLHMVQCSSR